jgi:hypothetical protein
MEIEPLINKGDMLIVQEVANQRLMQSLITITTDGAGA